MSEHTTTIDKTGVEAIDCTDCGTPHIVDYDRHEVVPADEFDPLSTTLDEDQTSFDCIGCGEKVKA